MYTAQGGGEVIFWHPLLLTKNINTPPPHPSSLDEESKIWAYDEMVQALMFKIEN